MATIDLKNMADNLIKQIEDFDFAGKLTFKAVPLGIPLVRASFTICLK